MDNIPLGQPILVGHHSEKRARKDQERIETGMRRAVHLWETSTYWRSRAAGAIRAAKYKERPDVRARRIKGLEADQRKHERDRADAEKLLNAWRTISGLANDPDKMLRRALFIANHDHCWFCFPLADYPRQPPASQYEGQMSVWSAMTDGIITPAQAADLAIPAHEHGIARHGRWLAHIANRIEYERAMLANAGGTITDRASPEKGGACRCWASPRGGWSYIQKVNKVSVTILRNWGNGGRNFTSTVEFDQLSGLMAAAEVIAAREAGKLVEAQDGTGFFLRDAPPPTRTERHADDSAPTFSDLKARLATGVQIAVVPQLFPTPPDVADEMAAMALILPGHRILEPSAGTGNLLAAIDRRRGREIGRNPACFIVAVEIDKRLAGALPDGLCQTIITHDFLRFDPPVGDPASMFDRILMNPPFANGADIKHIEHARRFLKPGGRLVAICADGPRQRERLQSMTSSWTPLPPDTFKDQGTSVRAVLLVIEASAACKSGPAQPTDSLPLFGGTP